MQKMSLKIYITTPNAPKEQASIPAVHGDIVIVNERTLAQIKAVARETLVKAESCIWRELVLDEEQKPNFELKIHITCTSKVQPDSCSFTVNTIPYRESTKKIPEELSKALVTEVQRIVAFQILKAWALLG